MMIMQLAGGKWPESSMIISDTPAMSSFARRYVTIDGGGAHEQVRFG
jgi:hypothetical protein